MFSSLLLPEEMKPFDDFGDEDGDDLMPLPSISALYKFCDDDTVYGCLMGDETNPEDDGPLIAYRVPDEELPSALRPPRPEPCRCHRSQSSSSTSTEKPAAGEATSPAKGAVHHRRALDRAGRSERCRSNGEG